MKRTGGAPGRTPKILIAARKAMLERMRKVAASRGGECLSKRYVNSVTELRWRCGKGHLWRATPLSIIDGVWCPTCRRDERLGELREIAASRGGACLSKRYVNKATKLRWRCGKGHEWRAMPVSIAGGGWCPACRREGRLEKLKKLAASRGGECLSTAFLGKREKMRWRCGEGHGWRVAASAIRAGSWCPECRLDRIRERQRTIFENVRAIALAKGGRCLSRKYTNKETKLLWECALGHRWEAIPRSIRTGSWCPRCSGRMKRTIADMRALARERGGECLSKGYVDSQSKLRWRCGEGHVWKSIPSSIVRGRWCPTCGYARGAEKRKLGIDEMRAMAAARGGECLSKEYVNSHSKLRWRCKEGHVWEAIPNSVKKGYWCPRCHHIRLGKAQRMGIGEMRDIARARGGECLSEHYMNSKTDLRWRCSKGHEWKATPCSVGRGTWCPVCFHIRRGDAMRLGIGEMRDIARARGGECLSKRYVDGKIKLRWKCKEGHEWEAAPSNVKSGTWCPRCHIIRLGESKRLDIGEMRDIARARGGECLSARYVNGRTKLRWKCKEGHEWEAAPINVKGGNWCARCHFVRMGASKRLGIGEMRDIARARGGECLSELYTNGMTKLRWKCKEGHEWEAAPAQVKMGTWCPSCALNNRALSRRNLKD